MYPNANKNSRSRSRGAALLIVLFVVMAITILSLGFLSRSDVELACGGNMILRTQMDYYAETGLEHAKGLILSPQDVDSEYWVGDVRQQLVAGSDDYYDVNVVELGECNYQITCDAYREKNGEKIGCSSLEAELRIDLCIAYWAGASTTISERVTINGDVYCNGTLINMGVINGDVFTNSLIGSIAGQQEVIGDLSLQWPPVTVEDFTSHYTVQSIGSILSGVTYGPYNPVRVCYNGGGDVKLTSNVQIHGMLVVDGDLTIGAGGNLITASKNLPALLVTGDLKVENGGGLDIDGLAVVDGQVQVSAGPANLNINGGLFTTNGIVETTADSSSNDNAGILYNNPTWRPAGGQIDGALEFNGDDTAVQIDITDMDALQGTISLWAYAESFDSSHHYLFGHTSTPPWWVDRIQLYTNDENGWLDLGLGNDHSRQSNIYNLDTHKWYHIGLTWDGTRYIVYVDGVARATGTYWGLSTFGPIADIGNDGNPVSRNESFYGIIDDVRIYDRVLDANDIFPPADGLPGLVGHWKLDEQGSSNVGVTAAPSKTAIVLWPGGVEEKWCSAAGAFFRSIKRK